MTLPINLVLTRHGDSEGNAANRLSEQGDNSVFTKEFRDRHSSNFRLTTKGQKQAITTGEWMRRKYFGTQENPIQYFDRYIVSEYIRAKETAGLLNLPNARWICESYLRERDRGDMDICTEIERQTKFLEAMRQKDTEPFFWLPPNGESFADLCLRIDRVLHTLHRECANKNVLIVCHGEVMRAFQVRIEHMTSERFREISLSTDRADRIHNCQVTHYTRVNPNTGKIDPHINWVQHFRPSENPNWESGWQGIKRQNFSNKELLEIVERVSRLINV